MSTRLIQIACLFIASVGLLLSFMLTPVINQQRVDRQLTYDVEVGDSSNPAYALGASLGSFRGVLINLLWQRSEELKQEQRFFESNNLAEYITTLQPRFPEAWNIQAWNMAYNISVKCKTKEERWDWVSKGMNLLRDRGIPNNPNAVVLYRSMAWILGHKMTGQTDDYHNYYKSRMAETWQTLLGLPNPNWDWKPEYRDPAKRPLQEDFEELVHGEWLATNQFAEIVEQADRYLKKTDREEGDYRPSNYFTTLSPDNLKRFYDDHPGYREIVEAFEALTGPDGEELELGLNTRTLRAFGRYLMFIDSGYAVASPAINNPQTLGLDGMALHQWLQGRGGPALIDSRFTKAQREGFIKRNADQNAIDLVPFLNMLRALALVGEYHMDPAYMLKSMQAFGPIDWRHPAAHALYWSSLGTLRAEDWLNNKDRIDLVNANRNIIHNLQALAHQGKINYRPNVPSMGQFGRETIDNSPDTRMIPAYDRAWKDTIAKAEAGEFGDRQNTDTYANGHENFLQAAVYLYYNEGKEAKARDYFERVKKLYAKREASVAAREGQYNLNLSDFARVRMDDDLGFQWEALIDMRIRLALQYGLDKRSQAVMKRHLDMAKQTYDEYLADRQTTARADLDVQARQGLPPFEDLVLNQFLETMSSMRFSLPQKSSIWQLAGPLLATVSEERPLVYEAFGRMFPFLQSQAEIEGRTVNDIAGAFPPPPGYVEWYQQNINQPLPTLPTPNQPRQNQ